MNLLLNIEQKDKDCKELYKKQKRCATAGNRTRGPRMASGDFTTKLRLLSFRGKLGPGLTCLPQQNVNNIKPKTHVCFSFSTFFTHSDLNLTTWYLYYLELLFDANCQNVFTSTSYWVHEQTNEGLY